MEKREKEHFKIETYRAHRDRKQIIALALFSALFLFILIDWIILPTHWVSSTSGLLFVLVYLLYLNSVRTTRSMAIILTRDVFIQTELEGVIPWEDIDHVEFSQGRFKRSLNIYYKKDHQIKRLRTFYFNVENRQQLLKSLKKFSEMYGFAFEEK